MDQSLTPSLKVSSLLPSSVLPVSPSNVDLQQNPNVCWSRQASNICTESSACLVLLLNYCREGETFPFPLGRFAAVPMGLLISVET